MLRLFIGFLLLVLAGCITQPASSQAGKGQANDGAQNSVTAFDAISLSRSPCFGACPIYSVTVYADGRVTYYGERYVSISGQQQAQADAQALEKLNTLLNSKRLPLIVNYRPGNPQCGKPVTTDMPGAAIKIMLNGKTRTLHYYKGCPNVPDWLIDLANQIDQAAISGRWVGGSHAPEILRAPSTIK